MRRVAQKPPCRHCSHCAWCHLSIFNFNFSYFSFHLELVQDSVGCDTTAAAATSRARTGYPVAVISPFWGTQPPHCTRPYMMPRGYTRATAAHRTWFPPLKKKSKSFVPFISNCPLAHTPCRVTLLAPQGHLDKFFFLFSLFPSHLEPVQDNDSQHHCRPLPSRARRPPPLAHHHTTCGTQANLPPHGPVTHATHRPRYAQPGRRRTCCHRYPNYIASTLTQPPVAATTSATSTSPSCHPLQARQPPRCTRPHTRRRHISAAALQLR